MTGSAYLYVEWSCLGNFALTLHLRRMAADTVIRRSILLKQPVMTVAMNYRLNGKARIEIRDLPLLIPAA